MSAHPFSHSRVGSTDNERITDKTEHSRLWAKEVSSESFQVLVASVPLDRHSFEEMVEESTEQFIIERKSMKHSPNGLAWIQGRREGRRGLAQPL
uniref:Uncharacterized protein n=1 Tax=Knipowitschia caucasica TaxID=637954 RepID=A0AAV2MQ35_KNICA